MNCLLQPSHATSHSAAITVACTEAQFLDVGSDATIACSVSGDTEPSVFKYWLKGSTPIDNSNKYRLVLLLSRSYHSVTNYRLIMVFRF